MKTVIIIQARNGSKRLPYKILKKIGGKNMLTLVIESLKKCKEADEIIVATSNNSRDCSIRKIGLKNQVYTFAGNEKNVLNRFYECSKYINADCIVRICADSPLINAEEVDRVIRFYKKAKVNYVCNSINGKPLIETSIGLAVEVFNSTVLWVTNKEAKTISDKEHVTSFMRNSNLFTTKYSEIPYNVESLYLCVDTIRDFERMVKLFKEIKNKQDLKEVIECYQKLGLETK